SVEKNSRSARVVDEELAFLQIPGEVLHGRVEVPVPAVVLDRVVPKAKDIHGLPRPVLVGNAREPGRPCEAPARPARGLDGRAQLSMDTEQIRKARRRPPAPAALRGDTQAGGETRRHPHGAWPSSDPGPAAVR